MTKRKRYGSPIWIFLVMAFTVQLPFQVSASKTSFQVEYINNRLTVNVGNVALGGVLAAIREKTGVEFVLSQELSGVPISIQMGPLPVVESLERILSHFNHAFIFGPNNKPIKVIILGYAKLDNIPWPREVAETQSVRRVVSSSSAETKDIKQPIKEGGRVRSREGVISTPSLEIAFRERTSGEEMVVAPSTETMVIHPARMDMIIKPSSETMVISPASVEGMAVIAPSTRTMAHIMESMTINAFTEESKSKSP